MTLDDIKADVTLTLTREHERLFKAADCNPSCHACLDDIEVGRKYMLATYKDRDVMLCDRCDIPALKRYHRRLAYDRRVRIAAGGSGFSRPAS